jgi:hypothetical protein
VACGGGSAGPLPPQDAGADHDARDEASCEAPKSFFPDADGDGYGDPSRPSITSCDPIPGYVANPSDCADADPRAHPGQLEFHPEPVNGSTATAPFDFDCDGRETEEVPLVGPCGPAPECAVAEGWVGPAVPFCGETGDWPDQCVFATDLGCKAVIIEKRVQACR